MALSRHRPLWLFSTFILISTILISLYVKIPLQTNNEYQAPLLWSDDPYRINGAFFVQLTEQVTFQQHVNEIGHEAFIDGRVGMKERGFAEDSYKTKNVDAELLAVLRANRRVEAIHFKRLRPEWGQPD